MVYSWTITSGLSLGEGTDRHPGAWHIRPWEPQPIVIRAVELTVVNGPAPLWLMAGNGIVPDTMLFVGRGEYHGRHDFPPNTGMPMMAKGHATKTDQYLDLHGACPAGQGFENVLYTVYYTVP